MSVASTDTLATMADFDLDSTGESGKLTLPPELVSAVLADAIGKAIHACIQDATASQKMFDYATFLEYWNDAIANLLGASRLFRSVVLEIIAAAVGLDCRDDCLMSVATRPQDGPPFSFYVYERLRSLVLFGISSRRGSLQPPPGLVFGALWATCLCSGFRSVCESS
ncbi:hypothetical protein VKT23_018047 [Stygiomarasmius scandens]|uniref:Uncharacterized protein n=1 Tax=Marasmiellus scandens TaxID=2682957 RepID=A0ABR1ISQ1_9AGAR